MKWLSRSWRHLLWAVTAMWRGQTLAFEIGRLFEMGGRLWVCTDVGSRTVCAVPLDDLVESRDLGPPYSIKERVLDRYDMDGCMAALPAEEGSRE